MSEVLRRFVLDKKHHEFRKAYPQYANLSEEYKQLGLSPKERMTRRFELFSSLEEPVFLPEERICFVRTTKDIPDCFTKDEWDDLKAEYFIHELGYMSNISPNYERVIQTGLLKLKEDADEYGRRMIDAILALSDRYCEAAKAQGKTEIAEALSNVPRYAPRSFFEALQFFRILHFSLWLEGNYHITVGRFDQYLFPYLRADMDKGLYTEETALALLEDFFISFNKDSDMYTGVQQGDNGQSMVLGGIDKDGNNVFNLLSVLCLKASKNLMMIDPKINLRVNKDTPLEIFELGTQLTKVGLGFPQYCNDDVVIDGLVRMGYDLEDARNYVAAACWEFIIPGKGLDVTNISAISFAKIIDSCLHNSFMECETFDVFFDSVRQELRDEADRINARVQNLWFVPSPFMNVMMDCGAYGKGKYNNFGIHGTGIATAVDSLAAIKKYIYDEKTITKEALLEAVDSNYENNPNLLAMLRNEAPKLGTGDSLPDSLLCDLMEAYADALERNTNCRGGKFRPGTGSAMYYLWHANELGASPDGRRAGEPLGTNFSPSLFSKIKGPFSVTQSFSKPNFRRVINGGPLTLEFTSSMFGSADSIQKVAALVKSYITMGGHQLQLNAVDTERMKDAQLHPELHRQLVVRIWGWSAYFVELDKEFQDHVMMRQQYQI